MGTGRGAPNKKGLSYFPKDVDFYEDDRIFDLLDRYGPLGVTVYDCILCIVYRNGYYAEIPLDKLSKMIVKMIGNKWVKNYKVVVQVVHFCSDIGLLNDDLMTKNIITSAGIQKRWYKIAVRLLRRLPYINEYWLLNKEENEEPLLNAPKNGITSEENRITSEEIPDSSERSHTKEKEKKINNIYTAAPGKAFDSPELEQAFQFFLLVRKHNGADLLPEQIDLLREELLKAGKDDAERIAIAKRAASGGWKTFCPVKSRGASSGQRKTKSENRFNNFPQRSYDYEQLEKDLLKADLSD